MAAEQWCLLSARVVPLSVWSLLELQLSVVLVTGLGVVSALYIVPIWGTGILGKSVGRNQINYS